MNIVNKYILLLFIALLPSVVLGQKESDKLRKQQAELEKKIAFTKSMLGTTVEAKGSLISELNLINRQIEYRKALITNINNQINQIIRDIEHSETEVSLLEKRIGKLKTDYAAMLRYAYKARNQYSGLMFVFSADDFNQAYKRIKYLQQIQEYRVRQVKLIKENQVHLVNKIEDLKLQKEQKQQLLKEKDTEQKNYYQDKVRQQNTLQKIRDEETRLTKELKDQEEQKKKIEKAIQIAIQKELEKVTKEKGVDFAETKEIKLAASNFEANKGKLPMPVAQGEITGKFGRNAHPLHPGIYTENNGIDITTAKGATVRAVFKGEVSSVLIIPGAGKVVMVSHGNYRTVYANLQEAYVQKGDLIDTKQAVGALIVDESGSSSKAHFEIWKISDKGMEKMNPAYWLYR